MDKKDIVEYWISSAENDYKTMKNLFSSGDYSWSLFIGHLVIEKMLKALYVQNINEAVPKTHDLCRLVDKVGLSVNDEIMNNLDRITTFNISARYPDYKLSFYKKCNRDFTAQNIEKIEEVRKWILLQLTKQ
jgi:HEPN domain-containing protein